MLLAASVAFSPSPPDAAGPSSHNATAELDEHGLDEHGLDPHAYGGVMWKDLPQETRRRELLETDQKNFCFPCKCVQCPPFELWEALPGTEAMNKGCKVSQGCLAKCLVLYGCAKCHTCKGGQAEERRRLQGAGGGTQIAAPEEGGGGKKGTPPCPPMDRFVWLNGYFIPQEMYTLMTLPSLSELWSNPWVFQLSAEELGLSAEDQFGFVQHVQGPCSLAKRGAQGCETEDIVASVALAYSSGVPALTVGGGGMPIGTNPPVGVGIGNGNGLMMLSGAPVCMVEVREKSVEIAVDMIIAAKQLSPASAVALKAQLSASTIPLDLMIELASKKNVLLSAAVIGQLPLYSVVQDQLVESADGFGNGAGGNAGSQGVRDCTAGGCDNDKYEDEQVVLPWATPGIGRRRRLSRQDVEGWNAELVAALRNTTALASANHSRVNQYQLAAALREIHFAGLQADD